jgi:hypothetical protein
MRKAGVLSILFVVALLAVAVIAQAQQPKKVPRIGYVSGAGDSRNPTHGSETFRQGLRDLGYIEGKNIIVEYRYGEGKLDTLAALVIQLVQLKVDVLVSPVTPAIRAAKESTKSIPIVMVIPSDPVATGLVDSLAHPGGNVTGVTRLTRDLSGKRLELLKDAIPDVTRVAVLWDANGEGPKISFKEYRDDGPCAKDSDSILWSPRSQPRFRGSISRCDQSTCRRAYHYSQFLNFSLSEADCGPCHKEPTSFNVRGEFLRRCWRSRILFSQRSGELQARRGLRG